MAIRTVVTRGFGNGTFLGTIPLVVTRGYAIGAAVILYARGDRASYVFYNDHRAYVDRDDHRAYVPYDDRRREV